MTITTTHLIREGVRLACRDYGGDGPPVLLLHGLAGDAEEWSQTASWLTARCRVIAADARGHGQSEPLPSDVSRDAVVADAACVIEQLGLGPTIVVGQSLGGLTAMSLAARRPELVRALVVVDASPLGGSEVTEAAARDLGCALRAWTGPTRPQWDAMALYVRTLRAALGQPSWDEWERISCPTLIVRAGNGVVEPTVARAMLARLPRATLLELPDAAHDLHLDQPDEWRRVLDGYINTLDL